MKILITGGTGFIGSALIKTLLPQKHQITVLSRNADKVARLFADSVTPLSDLHALTASDHFDIIINLAGASIFDKRWTAAQKTIIRDSRIQLTQQLIDRIATMQQKPQLLISGSAIGVYGDQGDTELTEQSHSVADFSQQLCADWEQTALQAQQYDVRVCLMRTGLVLGKDGGLLQRMLLPFKLGLGGRIGSGRQWMSWIHLQDWIAIAESMINDSSMQGVYNATAINPVTNLEFSKTLAEVLQRPACLPLPAFALKTLLGEMSELVLGSQKVLPERLVQHGFEFQFSHLRRALNDILK
ncbi:epimerase [Methyloprofundus sedimenti]|uniref:Epimerase n=1 Tax=Methyloprofundus sedimenti TaxID=1420851 RepID=A0A1V8M4K5_9GAMM|nr:TIGR01777 family oxidoreductase [Methyloprofundus sedimenti]OQK16333.1 epimerase [Methyloprofundus sedimenti]